MSVDAPPVVAVTLGELARLWRCRYADAESLVRGRDGFVELGILELDDGAGDGRLDRYRLTDRGRRIVRSFAEAGAEAGDS